MIHFLFALVFCFSFNSKAETKAFRLHLNSEPSSLDPNKQRTSSSSYVLGSLYRNIFFFEDDSGLKPDLGAECKRDKAKNLTCKLKSSLRWSDGTPLTSSDFLRTYRKILNPKLMTPRADLLFKIKNAEAAFQGKKPLEEIGIFAPDATTLRFEFQDSDPDFEYKLATSLLSPTREDLSASNGPYKIKEWKKGQKILLEPNAFYPGGHAKRPPVEFLFIEEDTVALQLYEKNELQFLRRLPTLFIGKYKARKDYFSYPVTRLDYLGFGPELMPQKDIRKALTYSLNYPELQTIFSSVGTPGCIGLPDSWFPQKAPCQVYDLKQIPPHKKGETYTLAFSALGGEDHKRATEWMQNQWSKNAQIQTRLESKENKTFLELLEKNPPAIFRKGVAPDRPTCLAALENFAVKSPENFIRLKAPEYEKILSSLTHSKSDAEKKRYCLKGTEYLLNNFLIIPLGPIHFSVLVKPEFVGWKMNQMNQLDLSNLHQAP